MLSYSFMTLVDTLFVGRLGAASLAAVGLGGITSFTLACFGIGLMRALKVFVSQAEGARQNHRAAGYLAAGLVVALGFGVINIVAGLSLAPLLRWVSASAEAGQLAADYLQVRVLGAPAMLLAVAVRETLYGQGDTKTPMRAALTANVLNIGLDALFILQLGWGARGAALASALAAAAELVPLCATRRGRALLSQVYSGGVRRQALANVREVWRLGLPLGLQLFLSVSVFALLTGAFAMMGKNDVAAHQVALQVIHVSFLPAYALGEAVSVLVGQAVGAGEDDLVTSVARQALFAAALYTGACGVLFAVTARLIAGLFARDPQLIDLIVQLLYVGAAFQVFDGANIVAGSVLRGVGDVSFAAWISVGSAWLITPVITYLLGFRAGLGVVGGWFGFVVELLLAAVVLWWRLERGGWLPAAAAERAKLHAQQPQTTLEPSLPRHLTNNATQ